MMRVLIVAGALAIVGLALPRGTPARRPLAPVETASVAAPLVERPQPVTPEAAIAREMARSLGDAIARQAPPEELQAYHDAIRRGGPASVPEMVAALDDLDPAVRMAALHALSGLRFFYGEAPRLIEEGLTLDAIARRFRVPVETVIAVCAAAWNPGTTDGMVRASSGLLAAGMSAPLKRDALSLLSQLAGESENARTALAIALFNRTDIPTRRFAFQVGIDAIAPADAVAIALDSTESSEWRLVAGLACARRELPLDSLLEEARRTVLDGSSQSRAVAIELLARLEPAQASAFLTGLLRDGDEATRLMALQALVRTRRVDEAVDAVKAVAADPRGGMASLVARRLLPK